MNVYTDPKLLDVQGALQSLPDLAITQQDSCVVSSVALNPGYLGQEGAIADKTTSQHRDERESPTNVVSGCRDKNKRPLSSTDNRRQEVGAIGFEPTTSASRTQRSSQAELRPARRSI